MSAAGPNTSRDEEIAMALQASIDQAADEAGSEGTYAVLPPESGSSPQHQQQQHTAPTAQQQQNDQQQQAMLRSAAKITVVAYGVWWVYSVLVRAWWFVFNLAFVFVPLGWRGVATRNGRFVQWFAYFLAVDVVFQLLFLFTYGYEFTGTGMVACLAMVASQIVGAYYTRRYGLSL